MFHCHRRQRYNRMGRLSDQRRRAAGGYPGVGCRRSNQPVLFDRTGGTKRDRCRYLLRTRIFQQRCVSAGLRADERRPAGWIFQCNLGRLPGSGLHLHHRGTVYLQSAVKKYLRHGGHPGYSGRTGGNLYPGLLHPSRWLQSILHPDQYRHT